MNKKHIDVAKAYRLFNIGATTIVTAEHDGHRGAMTAAWVMPMDMDKLVLILDSHSYTRSLIEKEGYFAVQLPTVQLAELAIKLGSESGHNNPHKTKDLSFFQMAGYERVPLLSDCAAWVVCKYLPDEHCQSEYDMIFGQIVAGWADDRIYSNDHWHLENVPEELKTIHYVAGGNFYFVGGTKSVVAGTELE